MAKHGGKRAGAGSKKGVSKKPLFSQYFNDGEIKDLVENVKKGAKKNVKLQMFLLEQIFGKARQGLDFGDDFVPTQIIITSNAKKSS